jgi:hypothetical protein
VKEGPPAACGLWALRAGELGAGLDGVGVLDVIVDGQVLAALAGIAITAPSDPPASEPATPMGWVLEIRTLGGGTHEFEMDDQADIPALQAEIANSIGSDGTYRGTARRPDVAGGPATFTIAWNNVAAATLYQRKQRTAA